eukprot:scaffold49168_cov66-Phaeocystis_antarctica.AAC.1
MPCSGGESPAHSCQGYRASFCLEVAHGCVNGELGFCRRDTAQRSNPLVVRSRLLELRSRARPRLPSVALPAQHCSPHVDDCQFFRRRPHHPRRQHLEPLVVPPLRLGHLFLHQHVEGRCRGTCPALRSYLPALLGLEESLRSLHEVPRGGEHDAEVGVRPRLVGLQGDGLAVGLGCSAPVLLRAIPRALSQQLIILVARLRGAPGLPLRDLAIPLLRHPTILRRLPELPQLLVKHPVQLPSARVRRAVLAAEIRRRQLFIAALIADRVLLSLVVHV